MEGPIGQEDAGEVLLVGQRAEEAGHGVLEPLPDRSSRRRPDRGQPELDIVHEMDHDLEDQLGLALEIPVQRGLGKIRFGGHVVHRRGREAAAQDDGFGGVQDGLAVFQPPLPLAVAPSVGLGHG